MEPETTKPQPSNIQRLKDNLPIISIGLLILGTVNMMLFYDFFNIDILSYLDFAEVLQIQFRLFATAGAVVVGFFIYSMFFYRDPVADHEMMMKHIDKESEEVRQRMLTRAERGYKRAKIFVLVLEVPVVIAYIVKMCLSYTDEDKRLMWLVSVLVFSGLLILSYKQITSIEKRDVEDKTTLKHRFSTYRYIVGFVILTYVSGVSAWINAMSYVSKKSMYEVTVMMEKTGFKTNKVYRYIGKTKNYTFFYNIAKKQAEVFGNDDIKKVFISEGKDYRTKDEKQYDDDGYYITKIKAYFNRQAN